MTPNMIKRVFALSNRSTYGAFHSVSRKHLHRYLSTFEYKYNIRALDDGVRVVEAIRRNDGRRLAYARQTERA